MAVEPEELERKVRRLEVLFSILSSADIGEDLTRGLAEGYILPFDEEE